MVIIWQHRGNIKLLFLCGEICFILKKKPTLLALTVLLCQLLQARYLMDMVDTTKDMGKWILALYEGWTELRRLDFPVLPLPVGVKSGFPNRLTYPGNEQQLNGTNYTSAASAIGGDKVETKLFWDKF